MSTKTVIIPDLGPITLYKRRGNRSLRLSMDAGGEVRVSLPPWIPYKAGEQFALSKREWIEAHRAQTPQGSLQHGQRIGKAHRLHFEARPGQASANARLRAGVVYVAHAPEYAPSDPVVQEAARKASVKALRKEATALLPQRLQTLSQQTGLSYNTVGVKLLKSRWGSCSSQKDITLNLFLMQLPWHLIDYVLVHELTHTKVMQHGTPFWQELERHLPGAKKLRKEIRTHRPILSYQLQSGS